MKHEINMAEGSVTFTTEDDIFTMTVQEAFNYATKLQDDLVDAVIGNKKNE